MKKVGLLVGRERTFPVSIIDSINERGGGEVVAEFVKVGGVRHDAAVGYDLIIDRISHEVPFYRAFLKRAALEGTIVINNPFWWSADDKFFNFSLGTKLGVAIPRTVLLPQKNYIAGITSESLRNLEYPLDWQDIADYVGFPAYLKPFDGGGWKNVSKVNSLEELWEVYDTTDTLCMTLQANVDWDHFVRCYCIGQEDVLIMPYDPRKAYLSGEQYVHDPGYLTAEVAARVAQDVLTLNRALGYDINTVEFAIKDGIPYAIDFMNPAPDAELASVGEFYHHWLTKAVTDLVFRRLAEPRTENRYRWDALLNPQPEPHGAAHTLAAAASAAQTAADSVLPQSVRDLSSNVVDTVTEFLGQATGVVSGLVDAVTEATASGGHQGEQNEPPVQYAPAAPKAATKSPRTAAGSKKGAAKGSTKRAASSRSKKPTGEGSSEA
ncbi:MAG: RimK family alpha-L-glutamate ligase [Pyrinomonadaceae bacterium]